jgi:hypothetical protein
MVVRNEEIIPAGNFETAKPMITVLLPENLRKPWKLELIYAGDKLETNRITCEKPVS